MIDKKDRNRRYIKNWRPISLLNVDVKLASTALALYVKSKFIIPLGISALWWLAESSSIDGYLFWYLRLFKYKPYEKAITFFVLFNIITTGDILILLFHISLASRFVKLCTIGNFEIALTGFIPNNIMLFLDCLFLCFVFSWLG